MASVPALWVVREAYPDAHITMLTDEKPGESRVQPRDILDGSGLIDDYIVYPGGKPLAMARLLFRLRIQRYNSLVYLIRQFANNPRVRRDKMFFRLAGIKEFIGTRGFGNNLPMQLGRPMPVVPHVADTLLASLRASGLRTPIAGQGCFDLNIGVSEKERVNRWLTGLPDDRDRPWVGVGIGGKMAVNLWPLERYESLLACLVDVDDVWPVVFGGPENRDDGQRLVEHWNRGYVACGALGIRETIAAISRCTLFVGNDTGTLHMAATAGVRCVGVYSSRNYPGLWDPYGDRHVVIRTEMPCEGCKLEECVVEGMKCILSISVDNVLEACYNVLREEALRKQAN